jgi:ketosteroid isomerase-like protein
LLEPDMQMVAIRPPFAQADVAAGAAAGRSCRYAERMEPADNKTVARGWFDHVMNGRDLSAIDRLYAEDYVYRGPDGASARGLQAAKEIAQILIDAMPDRVSTVEEQVAEGDRVVTRWVSRGTPTQPVVGRAPTGRPIAVHGITISRIANGRVAEDWEILQIVEE